MSGAMTMLRHECYKPESEAAGFSGTPGDIFLATGCSLLSSAERFTAAGAGTTSPDLMILMGIDGLPLSLPQRSIDLTMSIPSTTLPNTTCLPFR